MTETEGALIRRLDFEIERCDRAESALRATHAAIRALPRYDLVEYGGYYRDHQMDRADDGEWVKFEALARLLGDPAQEQP
jgi:hypothetical protein